jgi:hypothetical protein
MQEVRDSKAHAICARVEIGIVCTEIGPLLQVDRTNSGTVQPLPVLLHAGDDSHLDRESVHIQRFDNSLLVHLHQ